MSFNTTGSYGTLVTFDTIRSNLATLAQIGEDRAYAAVQMMLDAHNAILAEQMSDLVERTTDRMRRYGAAPSMVMEEHDELGTPDAQKITTGANVGFPLRLYEIGIQWTRKYLQNATGQEFAANFTAATDADVQNIRRQLAKAVFLPTSFNFTDKLVDKVVLPIRPLVNADGDPIPPDQYGNAFNPSTHTHYLGTASFTNASLVAQLETVIEHFPSGRMFIFIERGNEATVRGFADFYAYYEQGVTIGVNTARGDADLNTTDLYNRAIGRFHGAEVWVKPWIPANYTFVFNADAPKPLVMRTRDAASGDLTIAFEDEDHPLRAQVMEREFGLSAWTRTNGAVMLTNNGTYSAPTL